SEWPEDRIAFESAVVAIACLERALEPLERLIALTSHRGRRGQLDALHGRVVAVRDPLLRVAFGLGGERRRTARLAALLQRIGVSQADALGRPQAIGRGLLDERCQHRLELGT